MAGAGLGPDAGCDSVDAVKESVSMECGVPLAYLLSLLSTSGAVLVAVLVAVVVVVDPQLVRLGLPANRYH